MLPNLHVNEFKRARPAGGRVSAQEAPIRLEAINIFARFSPTFVRFPEYVLQRFPHFLNRKWKTLKSPCGKEGDFYKWMNAMF